MKKREGQAHEIIALPDEPLELVLRNPRTGGLVRLGVEASMRDLEVLGSAGIHYSNEYVNPERPLSQIKRRRDRAGRVGQALWDAVTDRIGIEETPA